MATWPDPYGSVSVILDTGHYARMHAVTADSHGSLGEKKNSVKLAYLR